MTIKVKIITAGMWYNGRVGECFDVIEGDGKFYLVEDGMTDDLKTRKWIRKKDVEVLGAEKKEEEKPPKKK